MEGSRFGGILENNWLINFLIILFGGFMLWLMFSSFGVTGILGLVGLFLVMTLLYYVAKVPYVGKLLAIAVGVGLMVLAYFAHMNGWFATLRTMLERLG